MYYVLRPVFMPKHFQGRGVMKIKTFFSVSIFLFFYSIQGQSIQTTTGMPASLSQVTKILGKSGQMQDGALIIRYPRSDLKVRIAGEVIPTALGLSSWVEWKSVGNETMMIGDFVLTENEIAPFILELERGDISVTGLYNHFLKERPRVLFVHVKGVGNASSLATTLRYALYKTATPLKVPIWVAPSAMKLDTGAISRIIGQSGLSSGGIYKFTFSGGGLTLDGVKIAPISGLTSWAGFMGTNRKAHVAGDIVISAYEVNRIIRSLKSGGINVVSIHNHMFSEQPRTFVLHYWGTGNAKKLARTIAIAFDYANGSVR
jgi:hypothetical protein